MIKKRSSHETAARRLSANRAFFMAKRKIGEASGIPVYCRYDVIDHAEGLKPHPDNAHRSHPPKQLDRYELVIAGKGKKRGNGWRKSIVVSLLSGCIIKGHGAWLMAKRRGWMVPVEYQQYRSRAEERRDLLADNKLPGLAITDDAKLAKLLSEMGDDDITLSGFAPGELEQLVKDSVVDEGEFPITAKLGESYDYVLIFTTNATEFVYLQTLLGIRPERSYKKTGVGLGRAIPLDRALKALRENRHSLDVQGKQHDHASAHPERGRVRASKPAR